jgi:hypothetical protein
MVISPRTAQDPRAGGVRFCDLVSIDAAAMHIRVDDRSRCRELVRYFRRSGFLAVERDPGVVEVVPIDARDEERDRRRTLAALAVWTRETRGGGATPFPDESE